MAIKEKSDEQDIIEKNEEEVSSPSNALNFERSIIRGFGLYPTKDPTTNKHLYNIKQLIISIITITFFSSMWANIFIFFDDTSLVIETLYFGLTQTTFVCKLINFHLRFDKFQELEAFLHRPVFNNYTKEQISFIEDARKNCTFFGRVFRAGVTTTILFYFVFPFLDNKLLPLPSYFPMDVLKFRYLLFLYQMIGIIINGYVHSALDVVVCVMISSATAQFEILKDNLSNLRKGLDDRIDNCGKNDVIVAARLREYVLHHNTIIKFSFLIDDMFQFVQFVQFLVSSIIICVTGYQITVTPITDLKFQTLVFYAVCNFIQVFMCCWFGQDIQSSSESVGESCYMSDWYNCRKSIGTTLFVIMERSKRPVTLTAGKFFNLSLETFVQVLRTSYSYLALLRRMNEVKEI